MGKKLHPEPLKWLCSIKKIQPLDGIGKTLGKSAVVKVAYTLPKYLYFKKFPGGTAKPMLDPRLIVRLSSMHISL